MGDTSSVGDVTPREPNGVPALECEGLWRTYPGGISPVKDVSLTVPHGGFVAITGPSGSGKTSLLALLGLLDRPDAGRYSVAGEDVTRLTEVRRAEIRSRQIGFVFQSFNLLPARTAVENVSVGLLYRGLRRSDRILAAEAALVRLGLAHRIDAIAATLSGGEQQRVAISRALAADPAVLFCDEPTGNLDSANTDQVLALLSSLNQQGLTIVVVTHDENVASHAQTRYVMVDGQLRVSNGHNGDAHDTRDLS